MLESRTGIGPWAALACCFALGCRPPYVVSRIDPETRVSATSPYDVSASREEAAARCEVSDDGPQGSRRLLSKVVYSSGPEPRPHVQLVASGIGIGDPIVELTASTTSPGRGLYLDDAWAPDGESFVVQALERRPAGARWVSETVLVSLDAEDLRAMAADFRLSLRGAGGRREVHLPERFVLGFLDRLDAENGAAGD